MQVSWQHFVATAPRNTPLAHLAAVVDQPVEAVAAARAGTAPRRGKRLSFVELFAAYRGREPLGGEWPKPARAGRSAYEWLLPEDALLATLVGTMAPEQIAEVLTKRLKQVSGDPTAARSCVSVKVRMQRLGLLQEDLVGGITVTAAGEEFGSVHAVRNAINSGALRTRKVGRRLLIPHAAWAEWKATKVKPPKGYVALASIREPLGIRSDAKLPEFASLGLIPTAVRCNPSGTGQHTTRFGTWYIAPHVARKLVSDRHAGRPMPWHGAALPDNLRATWKRFTARRHPASCSTCKTIWGKAGAPRTFDDFCQRYPPLAHGAKRHLTLKLHPGLNGSEVARQAKIPVSRVQQAIKNGALRAEKVGPRRWAITRTDATRWIARHCPSGAGRRSWITLHGAKAQYGFTIREIRGFIDDGRLQTRTGTGQLARGRLLVCRQQLAEIRYDLGFTEKEAAQRVGVPIGAFRELLAGVDWRSTGLIPLVTVQAVIKRLQSQCGYTIEEAAAEVGKPEEWVRDRIKDGTIRITRAKWDRRRLYVTVPMLERLRAAKRKKPRRPPPSEAWLRLGDAATLAGLCDTTIQNWRKRGEVTFQRRSDGFYYSRRSIKKLARRYWRNPKFRRPQPPAWFLEELA